VQASHAQHPPHSVRSWLATLGAVHMVLHVPSAMGLTVPAGQASHSTLPTSSQPGRQVSTAHVTPAGHTAAQAQAPPGMKVAQVGEGRGGGGGSVRTLLAPPPLLPPAAFHRHPCCWTACRTGATHASRAWPAPTTTGALCVGDLGAGAFPACVRLGADIARWAGVAQVAGQENMASRALGSGASSSSRAVCSAGGSAQGCGWVLCGGPVAPQHPNTDGAAQQQPPVSGTPAAGHQHA
jgi:hypothetical protein